MISDVDLEEINPSPQTSSSILPGEAISTGVPISKAARVSILSPDDWEDFIEEWAFSLKNIYEQVRKAGGAGDLGLDVIGFTDEKKFWGVWDNYQCKRYDHPLSPSDIWTEIGKIIYYSFKKEYSVPRKSYFVCSKGIGTRLFKFLSDSGKLKEEARKNWETHCKNNISTKFEVELKGDFLNYFEDFDFAIFDSKSVNELIEGHSKTKFHALRFGGGLPGRPAPAKPPEKIKANESRYIGQIFSAYSQHIKIKISCPKDLEKRKDLKEDYLRQRERFYHAESLLNFSRDTVPDGTFEALQEEVFSGVVDVCNQSYKDGFLRIQTTMQQAAQINITANLLQSVTQVSDRQGICHQLVNKERLNWVKKK